MYHRSCLLGFPAIAVTLVEDYMDGYNVTVAVTMMAALLR